MFFSRLFVCLIITLLFSITLYGEEINFTGEAFCNSRAEELRDLSENWKDKLIEIENLPETKVLSSDPSTSLYEPIEDIQKRIANFNVTLKNSEESIFTFQSEQRQLESFITQSYEKINTLQNSEKVLTEEAEKDFHSIIQKIQFQKEFCFNRIKVIEENIKITLQEIPPLEKKLQESKLEFQSGQDNPQQKLLSIQIQLLEKNLQLFKESIILSKNNIQILISNQTKIDQLKNSLTKCSEKIGLSLPEEGSPVLISQELRLDKMVEARKKEEEIFDTTLEESKIKIKAWKKDISSQENALEKTTHPDNKILLKEKIRYYKVLIRSEELKIEILKLKISEKQLNINFENKTIELSEITKKVKEKLIKGKELQKDLEELNLYAKKIQSQISFFEKNISAIRTQILQEEFEINQYEELISSLKPSKKIERKYLQQLSQSLKIRKELFIQLKQKLATLQGQYFAVREHHLTILEKFIAPKLGKPKSQNIPVERYFFSFLFILAGFILQKILFLFFDKAISFAEGKTATVLDDLFLKALSRPLGHTFVVAGFWLGINILPLDNLPFDLKFFLNKAAKSFLIVYGVWFVTRLGDSLCRHWEDSSERTGSVIDNHLIPIIRKSFRLFIIIIGLILIIQEMGYSASSLLAGFGLGGMAVALASKDTLSNLFGSLVILIDKPFKLGDWVEIGTNEGTIEEIGLRVTRIRTFANSLITIPNSQLTTQSINNWSKMEKRRICMSFGVGVNSDPDSVDQLVQDIRTWIANDKRFHHDFFMVNVSTIEPDRIHLFVYCFTQTTDWKEFMQIKQDFILGVMKEVKNNKLSLAVPAIILNKDSVTPEFPVV